VLGPRSTLCPLRRLGAWSSFHPLSSEVLGCLVSLSTANLTFHTLCCWSTYVNSNTCTARTRTAPAVHVEAHEDSHVELVTVTVSWIMTHYRIHHGCDSHSESASQTQTRTRKLSLVSTTSGRKEYSIRWKNCTQLTLAACARNVAKQACATVTVKVRGALTVRACTSLHVRKQFLHVHVH
jgi:hypothetical protein